MTSFTYITLTPENGNTILQLIIITTIEKDPSLTNWDLIV